MVDNKEKTKPPPPPAAGTLPTIRGRRGGIYAVNDGVVESVQVYLLFICFACPVTSVKKIARGYF